MGGVSDGSVLRAGEVATVVSSPEHDISDASGKLFPSSQFSHT